MTVTQRTPRVGPERGHTAAVQAAVLDALPANVALLDAQGRIVSVNEAWRRFAVANALHDADFGIGTDYLGVCDNAVGLHAAEAPLVARGLRAVLAGDVPSFSLEYPCHSPNEQRWFRMTVTPLDAATATGAVVMHVDISERVRAEMALRDSEQRHRGIVEMLPDLLLTAVDGRVTYINAAGVRLLRAQSGAQLAGRSALQLFVAPGPLALRPEGPGPTGLAENAGFTEQRLLALDGTVVEVEVATSSDRTGGRRVVQVVCRDLTERRRSELRLEVERVRLVQAQAVAHMGSWEHDFVSGKCHWSEEACRVFEVDAGSHEPTYERFLALVHPDDRAAVDAAYTASFATQGPQSVEHRVLLADGRIKTVEERWQVYRDAAGAPARALGTCQDITERKQAEQLLRRSQAMVQFAGSIARLGAWSVDLPSMTLHWSDVVAAIHDEPPGTSPTVENAIAYYVAEHREVISAHVTRCMTKGTPFDLELQIVTAKGVRRWVRAIGQPERDETGHIVRVQGAFQEISDRKQAEQATQELAHRFQTTLESITDGFFTLDADWRFSYLNSQAERLLGRNRESLLGRLIWNEYPEAVGSLAERQYRRAVRDRVAVAFEYEYPPLQMWFEVNAYPSSQGLAVYFCDVSDRKRDQDALRELNAQLEARVEERTAELRRAHEEAEQASQAKSAFLAAMSHEIRTPMNGVIGMIDVLHQTSLRGYQVEMVDLIRESAYSLLGIIEDILDFSKIEAGRMDIERAPLCLADIVEAVCGMLYHMAIKRDVRVALFVDPAIPSMLVGDEARLRQVLVNLIGNAIKFSGGRKRPGRVAVRAVLKSSDAGSATVEISVADNGIGMDEGTIARLFKPFTQGDASTTRLFGGTGLGLAISNTLVDLMGGNISVRSFPGEGARFAVALMLPRAAGAPRVEPAAALVAGLRCCVIGDDLPLAGDLVAYLACAEVDVQRASNPSVAAAAPLWILLPSQCETTLHSLRALARRAGNDQTRFLKLGSGYRRRPRVEAPDLVLLDQCGLTRRSLYRVLALASGRLAPDAVEENGRDGVHAPELGVVPRGRLPEGRRILVVEDNETNRKVIQQQLHLAGYDAEFSEDGQHALERWRSGDFAVVLTDLHMPRMDGYALAASIRSEEQSRGARRTAIVALTANALRDEERRCRAAGMDAYLSKPVRLVRLQAAIERWLPAADDVPDKVHAPRAVAGAAATRATMQALSEQARVDLRVLTALIGDDETAVAEVLRAFRDNATQSGAALAQACAAGDLRAVEDCAHRLKSGARSIGALELGERCSELEATAQAGDNDAASALLASFELELQAVLRDLEGR